MAADEYEDEGLDRLRAPAHDVESLAAALSDPRIGGFEVQRVFNRPAHEVNEAIDDFFADRSPDDVLLLYVSCHGVKDDAGNLYFATTNTRVRRLGSTGVASTFVRDWMTHSRSRNIILLLDCCYSGAFADGMVRRGDTSVGINERLRGSGRAILSSSSALEYAFELDGLHMTKDISPTGEGQAASGRPSIFTGALVEGLTSGDADQNRDGMISVDELYDYAFAKVVQENPNQTPTKFSDVSGELIVAYSPGTLAPPALPEEVVLASQNPLSRVRAVGVEALKELALSGGPVGRLAYERLTELLDDDSRTVIAKAGEAIAEIDGAKPGVYTSSSGWLVPPQAGPVQPASPGAADPGPVQPVHGWPGYTPSGFVPSGAAWPQPASAPPGAAWPVPGSPLPAPQHAFRYPLESGPVAMAQHPPATSPDCPPPPPWQPPPGTACDEPDDSLRARSVLAYFMPFFTSLPLAFSRSRNIRFHAFHCAFIDAVTTFCMIVLAIPTMLYTDARYGTEEVPQDDVPFTVFMVVAFFVIPIGLRAYCLLQIVRNGNAGIKFIGTLAHRMAYGTPPPPDRRARTSTGSPPR